MQGGEGWGGEGAGVEEGVRASRRVQRGREITRRGEGAESEGDSGGRRRVQEIGKGTGR